MRRDKMGNHPSKNRRIETVDKMNKHLIILAIAVLLICVGLSGCLSGNYVHVNDLVDNPNEYLGKTVIVYAKHNAYASVFFKAILLYLHIILFRVYIKINVSSYLPRSCSSIYSYNLVKCGPINNPFLLVLFLPFPA